jgi:hypothetical protein
MSGWYDSIELLFGPVGHTHNGIDAIHHKHNVGVGRYFAGTLAHWIHNYDEVFLSARTRPKATLCQIQYDWDEHYRNNAIPLTGAKKRHSMTGALLAVGFRVAKQENDPMVRVCYTQDTGMKPRWVGADSRVNSLGVVCLARRPFAPPKQIPPHRTGRLDSFLSVLKNNKFVELMKDNGAGDCMDLLHEFATTGLVPIRSHADPKNFSVPNGRLGTPAKIGTDRLSVDIDVFVAHPEGCSNRDFWCAADLTLLPRSTEPNKRPIIPGGGLAYTTKKNARLFNKPKPAATPKHVGGGADSEEEQGEDDSGVGSVGSASGGCTSESSDESDTASLARFKNNKSKKRKAAIRKTQQRKKKRTEAMVYYQSSDTQSGSESNRSNRRTRKTRGAASKRKANVLKQGDVCYALDWEKDTKWYISKCQLVHRPKGNAARGKKADSDWKVRFNGYPDPYTYTRNDIFATRRLAQAEIADRNVKMYTESDEGDSTGEDSSF